ncbi:hypothetical protein, partial [Bradyrhizobium sp.]|uniref:hypothetical protein n=1 Tax=Bradyrhizobium sp. TaxID=376 RepID=UPI002904A312
QITLSWSKAAWEVYKKTFTGETVPFSFTLENAEFQAFSEKMVITARAAVMMTVFSSDEMVRRFSISISDSRPIRQ